MSENMAIVQTMDFFTPIVDDPFLYGQIASANALSDVYAMGGKPITAMNIACFDPEMAPPEVWAEIFRGMAEKVAESGAQLVGGHTVVDKQPKFGLSVTGIIDPNCIMDNSSAKVGDKIYLSKPLGTGIITSAAKWNDCPQESLDAAIQSMTMLNQHASLLALKQGAKCATDITGFGLAGHLYNVARASNVTIKIDSGKLPLLPNLIELINRKNLTAGSAKNRAFLGESFVVESTVPNWMIEVVLDPQTSGGLAIFCAEPVANYPCIGEVVEAEGSVIIA